MPGEDVYRGLRDQILTLDPAAAGLGRTAERRVLWGALMEMGRGSGTATLVALADGTTSLYLSTGGGMIGGGFHQPVAEATAAFLACLEEHLGFLAPDPDDYLPASGRIVFRALAYDGRLHAEAAEDDLGFGRHPLSAVFYAGHGVITALRVLDEASGPGN